MNLPELTNQNGKPCTIRFMKDAELLYERARLSAVLAALAASEFDPDPVDVQAVAAIDAEIQRRSEYVEMKKEELGAREGNQRVWIMERARGPEEPPKYSVYRGNEGLPLPEIPICRTIEQAWAVAVFYLAPDPLRNRNNEAYAG